MNVFIFENCTLDHKSGLITATYILRKDKEEFIFTEKISFNKPVERNLASETIDELLKTVHLALGVSYWKSFCSPEIVIKNFTLSKEQSEFWRTVYTKGLGEFFFRNNIDFRNIINFPFEKDLKNINPLKLSGKKYLLGIGGGKDSIVSAEKLIKESVEFESFIVETGKSYKVIDEVLAIIGAPVFKVKREIDVNVLKNLKNTYNGHVPISLIYVTLAISASVLYGYKGFITSNESSANFGNTSYLGHEINHQWSKTQEFENMFNDYIHKYIASDIEYFSKLRNLSEYEITKEFAKLDKYFYTFSSCNRNFSVTRSLDNQENKWCGTCPKCAFVFLMLAAFLDPQVVVSIFQKNLLDNPQLITMYKELSGLSGIKPFECVGTKEEVVKALQILRNNDFFKDSAVIKSIC